jgi:MOSC domain-containing protein YiiM
LGEIAAIWIKRAHGGPMDAAAEAQLVAGKGIAGNADQNGRRQVTIIDEAAWQDAQRDVGNDVDPAARRANLMLRGVNLADSRGKHLLIGECVVRIFGETRPCHLMDEQAAGLRAALKPEWRGGVFGEIISGGTIRVGDTVKFLS